MLDSRNESSARFAQQSFLKTVATANSASNWRFVHAGHCGKLAMAAEFGPRYVLGFASDINGEIRLGCLRFGRGLEQVPSLAVSVQSLSRLWMTNGRWSAPYYSMAAGIGIPIGSSKTRERPVGLGQCAKLLYATGDTARALQTLDPNTRETLVAILSSCPWNRKQLAPPASTVGRS